MSWSCNYVTLQLYNIEVTLLCHNAVIMWNNVLLPENYLLEKLVQISAFTKLICYSPLHDREASSNLPDKGSVELFSKYRQIHYTLCQMSLRQLKAFAEVLPNLYDKYICWIHALRIQIKLGTMTLHGSQTIPNLCWQSIAKFWKTVFVEMFCEPLDENSRNWAIICSFVYIIWIVWQTFEITKQINSRLPSLNPKLSKIHHFW